MKKKAANSPQCRWRLPLLLSLTMHGCLAGWFTLLPVSTDADVCWHQVDSDCEEQEREFEFNILDIGEPSGRVAEAPRTVVPVPSVLETPTSAVQVPPVAEIPGTPPVLAAGQGTSRTANGGNAASPLFPVPAAARSVVYVIDRSGSMGSQGRLALARRELRRSLERLGDTVRFQVIPYNRRAEPLPLAGGTGLVPATAENVACAEALLERLVPEGGTEHLQALKQALLLQPEVIFFLTDADDLQPEDVRTLTRLNRGRTAIHVIELTLANRERHDLPLHRLAAENRGTYQAVAP